MLTPETDEKERGKMEPELPLPPRPLITSHQDATFDKICKIHIRVRIFMEGRHQVWFVLRGVPLILHRLIGLKIRQCDIDTSVSPSVFLWVWSQRKEADELQKKGRRDGWSWSLVDWFSPNCHVRAPDCTRQAPLSTQSPSLELVGQRARRRGECWLRAPAWHPHAGARLPALIDNRRREGSVLRMTYLPSLSVWSAPTTSAPLLLSSSQSKPPPPYNSVHVTYSPP